MGQWNGQFHGQINNSTFFIYKGVLAGSFFIIGYICRMKNISIATEEDIPELVNLVNSAYRGESSKKGWTTEAHLLEGMRINENSLKAMFGEEGSVILKYTNDQGTIIGSVHLLKENSQLHLGMLSVDPNVQAKSIGKQLLAEADDRAKANDCTVVVITVISVRHELLAWYERHGYSRTGEIKPFHAGKEFGTQKQALELLVLEKKIG